MVAGVSIAINKNGRRRHELPIALGGVDESW